MKEPDMRSECVINTDGLIPLASIVGDNEEDTTLLKSMAVQAVEFLLSQKWCDGVESQYLGYGVGGVVAIFLCFISSESEDVDRCLWTIVGDLPPAYLVTDENPKPADALEAYINEMMDWVVAVENGESTDDLIPVNAPPSDAYAKQLRSRLDFLRSNILPAM